MLPQVQQNQCFNSFKNSVKAKLNVFFFLILFMRSTEVQTSNIRLRCRFSLRKMIYRFNSIQLLHKNMSEILLCSHFFSNQLTPSRTGSMADES